jgi:hypothetical protein
MTLETKVKELLTQVEITEKQAEEVYKLLLDESIKTNGMFKEDHALTYSTVVHQSVAVARLLLQRMVKMFVENPQEEPKNGN